MYLYLLRHGEADWPEWDKPDDERPLTKRGKKEIKKLAKFLTGLDVDLDEILTSALPRAAETADIVAKQYRLEAQREDSLKPGFGHRELEILLQDRCDRSLMIVGHEPDFTNVITYLTNARMKLSKGGVVLLDVDSAKKGRLLWLFPPKFAKTAK